MLTFSFQDKDFVVHRSIDKFPDPVAFPMHTHDVFELYYFISGDGKYIVEGTVYDLNPGDVLLMRPGEAHKLDIKPTAPYERISMHFSESCLPFGDTSLLRPFLQRPLGQFNRYQTEHLPSLRRNIETVTAPPEDSAMLKIHTVAYLLPALFELCEEHDKREELREYNLPSSAANNIIAYVNSQLFEDIDLESIAEHFFLSKSQLNRIFKQATGHAVWEYIMIKRLMSARIRIRAGERVGDVAEECGFNDYSAFFRAYKKRFGVSPAADARNGGGL